MSKEKLVKDIEDGLMSLSIQKRKDKPELGEITLVRHSELMSALFHLKRLEDPSKDDPDFVEVYERELEDIIFALRVRTSVSVGAWEQRQEKIGRYLQINYLCPDCEGVLKLIDAKDGLIETKCGGCGNDFSFTNEGRDDWRLSV